MAHQTVTLIPWEGFDPDYPCKLTEACRDLAVMMADGQWHSRAVLAREVASRHGLQDKTVTELIRKLSRRGQLDARGGRHVSVKLFDA